ncbi:MAG: DUF6942 family protein [Cellvibrio sp.]
MNNPIGYGTPQSLINFYIGNCPEFEGYSPPEKLVGMHHGEIAHIVANTSNHWRKAFNVYAKVMWELIQQSPQLFPKNHLPTSIDRWQVYRDEKLFTSNGSENLLFSGYQPPSKDLSKVHIFTGKTYGLSQITSGLLQTNAHFWIDPKRRIIVAPYPDYRQLTNERISYLCDLIASL